MSDIKLAARYLLFHSLQVVYFTDLSLCYNESLAAWDLTERGIKDTSIHWRNPVAQGLGAFLSYWSLVVMPAARLTYL